MTRKLIILTDPGQDQAAAILMILGRPDAFEVLGLVATAGNIQVKLGTGGANAAADDILTATNLAAAGRGRPPPA